MKNAFRKIIGMLLLIMAVAFPLAPVVVGADATPQYTFTSIDMPGATLTMAFDINPRGVIVGSYLGGGKLHGFSGTPGDFTSFDFPGSDVTFTNVRGINPGGDIAGYYGESTTGRQHGFVYTKHGEWQTIDTPGHNFTGITRILPNGTTVGAYMDSSAGLNMTAVVRDPEGNVISALTDPPNACHESATPDYTTIVGYWDPEPLGAGFQSYVLEGGVFKSFHPSATTINSMAWDVSNDGLIIVGLYQDPGLGNTNVHGYIAKRRGTSVADWSFTRIDYPGADQTAVWGCNSRGDLVGRYFLGGMWHGFVATRTEN